MKKILALIISIFISISFADEFIEATTTIGGYGELHWDMEGEEMDFHRFVLFYGHNWDDKWSLKAEVELEHNMVKGGTYGGELELEQAYVGYNSGNFSFKGGVILAPVGRINVTHEPPTFLSVERPSYHKYIIPTTWFGNGFEFNYGMSDFSFGLTLMEDLVGDAVNPTDKYAFRDHRGKGDTSTASDLTKILSFKWNGVEGLSVGGSYTMNQMPVSGVDGVDAGSSWSWECDGPCGDGNPGNWVEDSWDAEDAIAATTIGLNLMELNVGYNAHNIMAVFEMADGSFDMDDYNTAHSATHEKSFTGHYLDLGYNIGSLLPGDCNLAVWTRISSWDSNTKLDDSKDVGEVSKSLFGITWWPNENVSFKVDMGTMDTDWTGDSSSSDVMNIGIGYMF